MFRFGFEIIFITLLKPNDSIAYSFSRLGLCSSETNIGNYIERVKRPWLKIFFS